MRSPSWKRKGSVPRGIFCCECDFILELQPLYYNYESAFVSSSLLVEMSRITHNLPGFPIRKGGSIPPDIRVLSDRLEGRLCHRRHKFRLIDLFSGAGGLTLGFTQEFGHSFVPVWANDTCEPAARTYDANFGNHCIVGDILDILKKQKNSIPEADVVIGGPPCQGFSLLNKKRVNDPRRQLWRPFLEVVALCGAYAFVMENVPQLLGTTEHLAIVAEAENLGFKVVSKKLCAADHGVSQVRYRAFLIGCRVADPACFFPPTKTYCNPKLSKEYARHAQVRLYSAFPWRTVRDAIADLPEPTGTELLSVDPPLDLHFGRNPTAKSVKRYRAIPREGMNRFDLQRRARHLTPDCWLRKKSGGTDLFGRLWWDRPAFTIRTEFFKPEKGRYLHPKQHRPITHREAARIQSFPDSFVFRGTKIEIARQIGNAVPPLLAARVADSVYAMLLNRTAGRH